MLPLSFIEIVFSSQYHNILLEFFRKTWKEKCNIFENRGFALKSIKNQCPFIALNYTTFLCINM